MRLNQRGVPLILKQNNLEYLKTSNQVELLQKITRFLHLFAPTMYII